MRKIAYHMAFALFKLLCTNEEWVKAYDIKLRVALHEFIANSEYHE